MKVTIELNEASVRIIKEYKAEFTRFSTVEYAINDLIFQFSLMLKDAKDAKQG